MNTGKIDLERIKHIEFKRGRGQDTLDLIDFNQSRGGKIDERYKPYFNEGHLPQKTETNQQKGSSERFRAEQEKQTSFCDDFSNLNEGQHSSKISTVELPDSETNSVNSSQKLISQAYDFKQIDKKISQMSRESQEEAKNRSRLKVDHSPQREEKSSEYKPGLKPLSAYKTKVFYEHYNLENIVRDRIKNVTEQKIKS